MRTLRSGPLESEGLQAEIGEDGIRVYDAKTDAATGVGAIAQFEDLLVIVMGIAV